MQNYSVPNVFLVHKSYPWSTAMNSKPYCADKSESYSVLKSLLNSDAFVVTDLGTDKLIRNFQRRVGFEIAAFRAKVGKVAT